MATYKKRGKKKVSKKRPVKTVKVKKKTEFFRFKKKKVVGKKPVKLERKVDYVVKDLKLASTLDNSFNKLNSDFIKFKKYTDEEFEEVINELNKYSPKKVESKLASLSTKLSSYDETIGALRKELKRAKSVDRDIAKLKDAVSKSKIVPAIGSSKDIDKIKEKLGVISFWNKDLNKGLGLVDSNVRLLIKDFEKHKESMKKLRRDFEDDLKLVNSKLKFNIPAPPISPAVEDRLKKVENDMSDIVDIAESSKDVADSSRIFMNEVDSQLVALTKLIEEYKSSRIEVDAGVYSKLDMFNSDLNELKNGFVQLSNSINDIGGKFDGVLSLSSELGVVKNKIKRLENAGFGALIIE